ncbi:MAG: T9SS type A sorting domain-containing protein [Cruoricaptor ignavus]|nr:T9SS type A sorting domain-containing protein [Cruoricaptor ignavus]
MKHFYKRMTSIAFIFGAFIQIFAQYSNGLIVANEGGLGYKNAEVSYIENNIVTNNVYSLANNGEQLGDILQSMFFYDDKALLVVNNSDKIVVVNRTTFKKITEISVTKPRYATVSNGKIYSTSAARNSIAVHDAETFELLSGIGLSRFGEEIHTINNKIYVVKSSFASGNEVDVIDPNTDEITSTITLANGLRGIRSNGTAIYSLSNPYGGSPTVQEIDFTTDTVTKTISNNDIKGLHKIAVKDNAIFVGGASKIYKLSTDLQTFDDTILFDVPVTESWYELYTFNMVDDLLYESDSNGFTAQSTLRVYNLDGVLQNTFTTGLGSNGVYKNIYTNLNTTEIAKPQISLYPNPVSETLFIKNIGKAQYQIFDISGKVVKAGTYDNGIAVQSLNKGLYIISVQNGNQKSTHKFIVK